MVSVRELPLTFGLGQAAAADGVRLSGPSGRVDRIGALQANQTVTVQEGSGVARKATIGAAR